MLTETTSAVAGIGGASVADSLGANAALTTGIGLGVQALGRAGLQYAQRKTHGAAQDRIAAAAGPLPVGGTAAWKTNHTVPVEPNERGQVAVSRVISTGALDCKEIVFSVEEGEGEADARLLPGGGLPRRDGLEMGLGRAGDRALGVVAVRRSDGWSAAGRGGLMVRPRRRFRGVAGGGVLGGCNSFSDLAGAASGTAAAAGSGNPAVGIAVGVGVRAVADWGFRRASRRWHRTEQEAIAAAAAEAPLGEPRPWQVRHSLPFGAKQGEIRVLREIDTPLAACREVAFSVDEEKPAQAEKQLARAWYLTSLCRGDSGWRWAAAEPATGRWGSLQ